MTYLEALDQLDGIEPNAWRLRELCAEDATDVRARDVFRQRVIDMARGLDPVRPEQRPVPYPPVWRQASNLLRSLGRWARSGFRLARPIVRARRKAICRGNRCGQYDAAADRCRVCGCSTALKPYLNSERCPRGHW